MADSGRVKVTVISNKFSAYAARIEKGVDMAVVKAAHDIEGDAKGRAPVDTGFLKNSINAFKVAIGHWRVIVGAVYGIYVEYGTSRMHAQPYLFPAFQRVAQTFQASVAAAIRVACQ